MHVILPYIYTDSIVISSIWYHFSDSSDHPPFRKFAVPCTRPTVTSPPAPRSGTSSALRRRRSAQNRRRRRRASWRCRRWRWKRAAFVASGASEVTRRCWNIRRPWGASNLDLWGRIDVFFLCVFFCFVWLLGSMYLSLFCCLFFVFLGG